MRRDSQTENTVMRVGVGDSVMGRNEDFFRRHCNTGQSSYIRVHIGIPRTQAKTSDPGTPSPLGSAFYLISDPGRVTCWLCGFGRVLSLPKLPFSHL